MPLNTARRCFRPGVLALGIAAGTGSVLGDDDNWTRNFRLGAVMSINIDARFSLAGISGVAGHAPGPAGVKGVDHVYDDGFVRVDQTGNAGGLTSLWGYTSSSQYDSAAHTLTFHNTQSYSAAENSQIQNPASFGLDLAYGGQFASLLGGAVGWESGFGWMPISIQDAHPVQAVFDRVVQSFDTGTILLPQAPYNGGAGGQGPLVHDLATALPNQAAIGGTITGTRKLELTLFVIRLGPTLHWELLHWLGASIGAGGAVGVVDGSYRLNETLNFADGSTTTSSARYGKTATVLSGYASATLYFHLDSKADLYLGAQYLPLGRETFGFGASQAELNLGSNVQIMGGINWPF